MLPYLPFMAVAALVTAPAPAPARYVVHAEVMRDGVVIATPTISVLAGTTGTFGTDTYRLTVKVTPVQADQLRIDSSFALPEGGRWEPNARFGILSRTGNVHYSFDGDSVKFTVKLRAVAVK